MKIVDSTRPKWTAREQSLTKSKLHWQYDSGIVTKRSTREQIETASPTHNTGRLHQPSIRSLRLAHVWEVAGDDNGFYTGSDFLEGQQFLRMTAASWNDNDSQNNNSPHSNNGLSSILHLLRRTDLLVRNIPCLVHNLGRESLKSSVIWITL